MAVVLACSSQILPFPNTVVDPPLIPSIETSVDYQKTDRAANELSYPSPPLTPTSISDRKIGTGTELSTIGSLHDGPESDAEPTTVIFPTRQLAVKSDSCNGNQVNSNLRQPIFLTATILESLGPALTSARTTLYSSSLPPDYDFGKLSSKGSKELKPATESQKRSGSFKEVLNRLLPLNGLALVEESSEYCIANTKNKVRCKNKKNKAGGRTIESLMNRLSSTIKEIGDDACFTFVHDLSNNFVCKHPHRKELQSIFQEHWSGQKRISGNDHAEFCRWFRKFVPRETLAGLSSSSVRPDGAVREQGASSTDPQDQSTSSSHRPLTRSMTNRNNVTVPPNPTQGVLQRWERYMPASQKAIALETKIYDLLTRKFKPDKRIKYAHLYEKKGGGYIYAYWVPPNFGFKKIGLTTREPETRFREWEEKCGHLVQEAGCRKQYVKYVHRVEKLVHAELHAKRFSEIGCKCKVKHQEWFHVDEEEVMRIVAKYAPFMETDPYELVQGESGFEWHLKKDVSKERIAELCKPVDFTPPQRMIGPKANPRRPSNGKRRSTSVKKEGTPNYR